MENMAYVCSTLASETSLRTSAGIQPNLAAVLTYVLGWVTGIIFLILERENRFVRFHAIQSIAVFGVLSAAGILLSFVPVFGWMLNVILGFIAFTIWIVLMARASLGETCTVPFSGSIAQRQLKPRS